MDTLTLVLEPLTRFLLSALTFAKVAVGLGFVIFIHELGHFVMAKWNGVKVEKFSIGFGPTLFGFRRGETEYVLAALPLGGFVKMLGEGIEDDQTKSNDPRAYPNKSVGARMAIISAGVIMNIILGFICFAYVYGRGTKVMPASIGVVAAGSPAFEAGMKAGDDIVSIDGRNDPTFQNLLTKVALSGSGQVLHFGIKRTGEEKPLLFEIQPVRTRNGDHPTIGIVHSSSLDAIELRPPAGMANPPVFPKGTGKETQGRVARLVSVAATGQPTVAVTDLAQYHRLLSLYVKSPLVHTFEVRHLTDIESDPGPAESQFELTLPPAHFLDFGFRFTTEPISHIRRGSPADKAGLRKGDKIRKFDGQEDFDPIRLPSLCLAAAGKPTAIEILRAGADGHPKPMTFTVTPDDSAIWTSPPDLDDLQIDVAGLGVSIKPTLHIAAVKPGSPAEQAGLKAGDVINSVIFHPVREPEKPGEDGRSTHKAPEQKTPERPVTMDLEDSRHSWVNAFSVLQRSPMLEVELVVNHASQPRKIKPVINPDWYYPMRGLGFRTLLRNLPPQDIASSFRRGMDDTIENILSFYATIRGLVTSRVSPTKLGGVITIVDVASSAASLGFTYLIQFLGILSINLAVLNFLPIPPLDGGQMAFLIAEKVRGRPLPESALTSVTMIGLGFVVLLILFVTYQDLFRLIAPYIWPTQ